MIRRSRNCLGCKSGALQMFWLTYLLTYLLTMSFLGYPKIIPCTKFEHFGVIRFWVVLRTNRQRNRRTRTSYPRRPTQSVWVITLKYIVVHWTITVCLKNAQSLIWVRPSNFFEEGKTGGSKALLNTEKRCGRRIPSYSCVWGLQKFTKFRREMVQPHI